MTMKSWQEILKDSIDDANKKILEKSNGNSKIPLFFDEVNKVSINEILDSFVGMTEFSKTDLIIENCKKNGIPITYITLSDGLGVEDFLPASDLATNEDVSCESEHPTELVPEAPASSPTEPTCGVDENGEFFLSTSWGRSLSDQERQSLAEHERMHLRFAGRMSQEQKLAAFRALAAFELGAWNMLDELLVNRAVDSARCETETEEPEPTTVRSAAHPEADCKTCSRRNTVGSTKCWWCETPNPC